MTSQSAIFHATCWCVLCQTDCRYRIRTKHELAIYPGSTTLNIWTQHIISNYYTISLKKKQLLSKWRYISISRSCCVFNSASKIWKASKTDYVEKRKIDLNTHPRPLKSHETVWTNSKHGGPSLNNPPACCSLQLLKRKQMDLAKAVKVKLVETKSNYISRIAKLEIILFSKCTQWHVTQNIQV